MPRRLIPALAAGLALWAGAAPHWALAQPPGDAGWMPLDRYDLLAVGLALFAVSLATAHLAVGRVRRRIAALTARLRRIDPHDLTARLDADGGPRDELAALVEGVNEMLDRLEAAYRRQGQFVADASHELRTPVAIIRGYAGLLRRWGQADPEVRQEAALAIEQQARSLGKLVGELLSLARADAGLELERSPVDLRELVLEVLRHFRLLAGSRELRAGPLEPATVSGDADRLRQLLLILLDNARKYTAPDAWIAVRLRAEGGMACLEVEDAGSGIPAEDLPHIFDRFYRADKARSRAAGGTGLGLAIAHWIVRLHGGSIGVSSEPGVGSRFTVRLPALGVPMGPRPRRQSRRRSTAEAGRQPPRLGDRRPPGR